MASAAPAALADWRKCRRVDDVIVCLLQRPGEPKVVVIMPRNTVKARGPDGRKNCELRCLGFFGRRSNNGGAPTNKNRLELLPPLGGVSVAGGGGKITGCLRHQS